MARSRRKKQGSAPNGLFFKALVTLIVVLVMLGSFLLFVAWGFFEKKYVKLARPKSLDYFAHTKEELLSLSKQEQALSKTYARLNTIEIEGQNLSKRQDGFYNERSQKGKAFNAEIIDLRSHEDSLTSSINQLEALPDERLKEWSFYATAPLALRVSCLSYILSFCIFAWLEPKWVTQLSETMQKFSFLDFYASYPIAYGASVGALVISLVFLFVSYLLILDSKIESLSNQRSAPEVEGALPVSQMLEHISKLPHATLKMVAEKYEIQANKKSKSTIVEAIRNQDDELIYEIYQSVQEINC